MRNIPRTRSAQLALLSVVVAANLSLRVVAEVAVDGNVRYQTMNGFGSSVRVFDDPHVFENFNPATGRAATVLTTAQQNLVLDKLYSDLKLTRVRPASPYTAVGSGIEPINDNSDPSVTDLTKFNFAWKNLDAHVDHILRAQQRGASTAFSHRSAVKRGWAQPPRLTWRNTPSGS